MYSSTSAWKPIDLPILKEIELTSNARELPRAHWPRWAVASTQFNRVFAYSRDATFQSTSPSTGIVATLLTERIDPRDAPRIFNYNFYLIGQTTDGRLFQSPPITPTHLSHHSSCPSTSVDRLGAPS